MVSQQCKASSDGQRSRTGPSLSAYARKHVPAWCGPGMHEFFRCCLLSKSIDEFARDFMAYADSKSPYQSALSLSSLNTWESVSSHDTVLSRGSPYLLMIQFYHMGVRILS